MATRSSRVLLSTVVLVATIGVGAGTASAVISTGICTTTNKFDMPSGEKPAGDPGHGGATGNWGSITSQTSPPGLKWTVNPGYAVTICAKGGNTNDTIVVTVPLGGTAQSGFLSTPPVPGGTQAAGLSHWGYSFIQITDTTQPSAETTTTTLAPTTTGATGESTTSVDTTTTPTTGEGSEEIETTTTAAESSGGSTATTAASAGPVPSQPGALPSTGSTTMPFALLALGVLLGGLGLRRLGRAD